MSLKKIKIIDVFCIMALSVLFHFLYKWLPNPLFAWTMPVNESIWEHLKLFFTSTLVWAVVDHYLLNKNNIIYNNFPFQLFFSAFIVIPIYMLIYLPIYNLIGENMIFSIGLMFVVYIIGQFISYKMLNAKDYGFLNKLTIPLILLIYGIFIFYTYKPIHNYIFYDKVESKYGIDDYTKTISD